MSCVKCYQPLETSTIKIKFLVNCHFTKYLYKCTLPYKSSYQNAINE